ncbi:MAG: hypothetical protein GY717_09310 [Rhodobacteraceae bacterium]|nr:hypothetical protein [Paracoccaceae bacterium]
MGNDLGDTRKLEDDLLDLVSQEAMVRRDKLTRQAKLEDLDMASADFVMILMAIEEKYGAYISVDNELADLKTVQDLLTLVTRKIVETEA